MISRSMFAALVAAFTLSATLPAHAAGGQRGTFAGVVDTANNQPVAGATVTLTAPTGRYTATTDASGKFRVLGVGVDTYTIRVSKPGYADAVIPNVDALGDQTQDVGTIVLNPA